MKNIIKIVALISLIQLFSLNAADNNAMGYTPLIQAILNGNKEKVEMLIEAGADLDVRTDSMKLDPLAVFLNDRSTPLMVAISSERKDIVQMLIDTGADLNAQDRSGDTPLMIAINTGNYGIVRMLINAGADLSIKNNSGETALTLATGDRTMVKMLKEASKEAEGYCAIC